MGFGLALKTKLAKKIDKNARGKMQEALPAVLKGLGGMPRLKDTDRPANELPVSALYRFNYGHPKTKNNAPPNFKPKK